MDYIEQYVDAGHHREKYYDSIGFWYCVTTLTCSNDEEIQKFVTNFVVQNLALESLWIYRRVLHQFSEDALFPLSIRMLVEAHFKKLQPTTQSYIWANSMGLGLPDKHDWWIEVRLQAYEVKQSANKTNISWLYQSSKVSDHF